MCQVGKGSDLTNTLGFGQIKNVHMPIYLHKTAQVGSKKVVSTKTLMFQTFWFAVMATKRCAKVFGSIEY